MDKFEYANINRPGLDAWDNDGRRNSAKDDFAHNIQNKPVSKEGIEKALLGINLWSWGPEHTHIITKATVTDFFEQTGMANVEVNNDTGRRPTKLIVRWDPEKGVIKSKPKSNNSDLEKRVAQLESQVALLLKMVASK